MPSCHLLFLCLLAQCPGVPASLARHDRFGPKGAPSRGRAPGTRTRRACETKPIRLAAGQEPRPRTVRTEPFPVWDPEHQVLRERVMRNRATGKGCDQQSDSPNGKLWAGVTVILAKAGPGRCRPARGRGLRVAGVYGEPKASVARACETKPILSTAILGPTPKIGVAGQGCETKPISARPP